MDEVRATISDGSLAENHRILQLIHNSFLDKSYQTNVYWRIANIKKIDTPHLEDAFRQKKFELAVESPFADLVEDYLFTCYNCNEHISMISQQGLFVQQSRFNFLGNSLLGVILCKHADVQLKAAQNDHQDRCWLMVFKVLYGRKLAIHPSGNLIRGPTVGADCHVSSIPPMLGETLGCQAIKSQVYLYEVDRNSNTGFSVRPRQCVPEAFVEFVSSLSLESPMPTLTIRHQSVQTRQKKSRSGSNCDSVDNCQISCTSAALGSHAQNSSYFPQFLPYQPKSSNPHDRQNVLSNFISPVSQKSPPSYSSVANQRHVSPQMIPQRLVADDRASNSVAVAKDDRLSLLTVCQNLVINLLQNFAKEMNSVAGTWRTGCSVSNTPSLLNAVSTVQELRQLFQQLAPMCQQFYKFVDDAFAGRRHDLPQIGVIQDQISTLNTCNSTMLCVFSQYRVLMEQKIDAIRKGGMMVQAVISTKHLLEQCLTMLRSSLASIINGLCANRPLGNTSDIEGCAGQKAWHQPSGPSPVAGPYLLQELCKQTTNVPSVTSNLSPSLASLFAMTGDHVVPPPKHSTKSSASSVSKSNEFQQHFSNSGVDETSTSNIHSLQLSSSSGDDSSVKYGLRVPIVIAPDDSLIDEVVCLDVKPLDEETDRSEDTTVKLIKQEKVSVVPRKNSRQTVFIDADEMSPESLIDIRPIKVESDSDCTKDLNVDVQDDQNSAINLVKVYRVLPDKLNEDQVTGDQQTLLDGATSFSDGLDDQLISAKCDSVEPVDIRKVSEPVDQATVMSPCILDLSMAHSKLEFEKPEETLANKDVHCNVDLQKSSAATVLKKQNLKVQRKEFAKSTKLNFSNLRFRFSDWYTKLIVKKAKLFKHKFLSVKRRPKRSHKIVLKKRRIIKTRVAKNGSMANDGHADTNNIDFMFDDKDLETVSCAEGRTSAFCSGDLQPRDCLSRLSIETSSEKIDSDDYGEVVCKEQELLFQSEKCTNDILHRPSSVSSQSNFITDVPDKSVSFDPVDVTTMAIKIEPETLKTEQLPSQHESLNADIIAEVIANTSEFTGNNEEEEEEEAENESGCLKIRIENVCSIASEGFDNMNDSICTDRKLDTNFKDIIQTQHEDFNEIKITVALPNGQDSRESNGDVLVKEYSERSKSACAKERMFQNDEFVDVGDVEYSLAVGPVDPEVQLKVDNVTYKKEESQFENFDDSDVEIDVFYENASDNDEDLDQNKGKQSGVDADDLENSEVLKFYSLGGDTYETSDVHSALDAMSHNVARKALADCSTAERNQNSRPKSKRRRKRTIVNTRARRKSKVGNDESRKGLRSEVDNGEPVLDDVNRNCTGRELISPIGCVKKTKRRMRKRVEKLEPESTSLQPVPVKVMENLPMQIGSSNTVSNSNVQSALLQQSEVLNSDGVNPFANSCTVPELTEKSTEIRGSTKRSKGWKKRSRAMTSLAKERTSLDDTSISFAVENREIVSDSCGARDENVIACNQESLSVESALQEKPPEAIPEMKKTVTRRRRKRNCDTNKPRTKTWLRSSEVKTLKDGEPCSDSLVPMPAFLTDENAAVEKATEISTDTKNSLGINTKEATHQQGLQCLNDEDVQNIVSVVDCRKTSKDECSSNPSGNVDASLIEIVADVPKPKRRKKHYAMTARPKRRKKSASRQQTGRRISKNIETSAPVEHVSDEKIDVKGSGEKQENSEVDLKPCLPSCKEKTFADVQNLVHNLFLHKLPVIKQRGYSESEGKIGNQLESPGKTMHRKRKRRRRRRRNRLRGVAPSLTSLSLSDMLSDNKFLDTLKSAVKTISSTSSSKPSFEPGNDPMYYTHTTGDFQNISTNNCDVVGYGDDGEQLGAFDDFRRTSPGLFHQDSADINVSDRLDDDVAAIRSEISHNSVLNDSASYNRIRNALETIAGYGNNSTENCFIQDIPETSSGTDDVAIRGLATRSISSSVQVSNIMSDSSSSVASPLMAYTNPVQAAATNCVPAITKTVIPLSVYLRNVREANYKQMKDCEGNCTTPAFYTGVVHNPLDGQANQHQEFYGRDNKSRNVAPVSIRDPRVARMRSQSTDLQSYVKMEPHLVGYFQNLLTETHPVEENIVDKEGLSNRTALQNTLNRNRPPQLFHSFSFPDRQEKSKSNLTKPVCSISPFVHKSDKQVCKEEKQASKNKEADSKTAVSSDQRRRSQDGGGWRLIPISDLLPRPPLIFARLPLAERKIAGFPSDPRVRCDRDLSVCRKLRKPDKLSDDDSPLIIDETGTSKTVKPRNSLGKIEKRKGMSALSECEISKERNAFTNLSHKEDALHFENANSLENETIKHVKSPLNPDDDILQDLLMSIESGSYETEMKEKKESGLICGLNKDRVLGNRSYAAPNLNVNSEIRKKNHSSIGSQPNSISHSLKRSNHHVIGQRQKDRKSVLEFDQNIMKKMHHQREGKKKDMLHHKERDLNKLHSHLHKHHGKDNGRTSRHHRKHFSNCKEKPHGTHLQKELAENSSRRDVNKEVKRQSDATVNSGENSHKRHKPSACEEIKCPDGLNEKGHLRLHSSHPDGKLHENQRVQSKETLELHFKEHERCKPKTVDASDEAVKIAKEPNDCMNDDIVSPSYTDSRYSLDEKDDTIKMKDFDDDMSVIASTDVKDIETMQNCNAENLNSCQDTKLLDVSIEMNKCNDLESNDGISSEKYDRNADEKQTSREELGESEEGDQSSLVILLDDDEEDAAEPERVDRHANNTQKLDSTGKENSSTDNLKCRALKEIELPDCMQESFPLSVRVTNQSSIQVRAEILKSIQSLKSSLENRLKSAVGDNGEPLDKELDISQTAEDNCVYSSSSEKLVHDVGDELIAMEAEKVIMNDKDEDRGDDFRCTKKLKTDSVTVETTESQVDSVLEATDTSPKADNFSDLSELQSSSRPLSCNRLVRCPWKVANEWSNISSHWTELSKDYDFPIHKADDGESVIKFMSLLDDVPADTLAAYKEVMKREIAVAELKIINSKTYFDPCNGLDESQIKKLLGTKSVGQSAGSNHDKEILLECDILELDKELSKTHESMEEIKTQLSIHPSPALDKTYDELEQRYNFLNVKMDMYQSWRSKFQKYQKSNFVHTIPDEFLFNEELGRYVSLEGMLLFLNDPTISAEKCVKLAALKKEILHTILILETTNVKLKKDIKRLKIKLGWLHLQRKLEFQELCCTTMQVQLRLKQNFEEKVITYRSVQRELNERKDPLMKEIQKFVHEVIYVFESFVRVLGCVEKSREDNDIWKLNEDYPIANRRRSRSHSRSRASSCSEEKSNFSRSGRNQHGDCSQNFDYQSDFNWAEISRSSYYGEGSSRFHFGDDGRDLWNYDREEMRARTGFDRAGCNFDERPDFENIHERWYNRRYDNCERSNFDNRFESSDNQDSYGSRLNRQYRDYDQFRYDNDPSYSYGFSERDYSDRAYHIRDYSDLDYNNHDYADHDYADDNRHNSGYSRYSWGCRRPNRRR